MVVVLPELVSPATMMRPPSAVTSVFEHVHVNPDLVERDDLAAEIAHGQVEPAAVGESDVDAPGRLMKIEGKIYVGVLLECLLLLGREGEIQNVLDILMRDQRVILGIERKQVAPDAHARALPLHKVDVGTAIFADKKDDALQEPDSSRQGDGGMSEVGLRRRSALRWLTLQGRRQIGGVDRLRGLGLPKSVGP